jgi:hypothetical protein
MSGADVDDAKSHSARTLWVGAAALVRARQRWTRRRCGAWLSSLFAFRALWKIVKSDG